jgi:phosphatidylinositol alpha-1,6-mannosyltransferase
MNIVIPTADYPPIEGGIGTVSLQVSRELARLGHDVTVIAPYFPNMKQFDRDEPVTVVRFRGYKLGWLRFFPMYLKARKYIKGADLVFGINIAYGATMAWRLKKPYVAFAYAYEFLKFGEGRIASMLKEVYAGSLMTVSISKFTANELRKFGVAESKIVTILPGAPEPRAVPATFITEMRENLKLTPGPLLLAVGRLIPRKGYTTLIEAMPAVLKKHPDTQLVCVGRGPLLDSLRARATKLGVSKSVRFAGYLSDEEVATLYQMCTLFVLPTGTAPGGQVEGFGLVFAEANAYAKPAIAGRSGGTVDAIVDDETGIIIEPNDSAACAAAILSLLDNPDRAAEMGKAGKRRVDARLNWSVFTRVLMRSLERDS